MESAYGGIVGEYFHPWNQRISTLTLCTTDPMPSMDSDDDDWDGISASSKGKQKQKQQEYEDEEVLATVAVVEDFDPDTLIHGDVPPPLPSDNAYPAPVKSVPRISKSAPTKSKPKKVRYQTKDARKADRSKQHARKLEKAELAGGKASRRKGPTKRGKPRK